MRRGIKSLEEKQPEGNNPETGSSVIYPPPKDTTPKS